LIKIPVAGRDNAIIELRFFPVFFQPGIGPDIDALLLSGIDFAPSLEAPAAGPVALVLRALRHWAEVGHIDEGAVPTVLAVKEHDLSPVFQFVKNGRHLCPCHSVTESLHGAVKFLSRIKQKFMEEPRKPIGTFDFGIERPKLSFSRLLPVKASVPIALKVIKAVVDGIVEVPDEVGPLRGKCLPPTDNFFHLFIFNIVPANMDPVVTHSF
jgi:hypothetical protein